MSLYRLYIDESGDHNYSESSEIRKRYLCLVGIILPKEAVTPLQEKIRTLQNLVGDDYDDPSFHGNDIKSGRGIFAVLRADGKIRNQWNDIVFSILSEIDFRICSVTIDKRAHKERYGNAALHPYHYCFNLIVAGYVRFLENNSGRGDILAESRGKREDRLLDRTFTSFYTQGNQRYSSERIQKSILSKSIKLKTKEHGLVGLMLADLLALTVKLDILIEDGAINALHPNFIKEISDRIRDRYACVRDGDLKDFCKKLV